jgi:hypothetical protein
MKRRKIMEARAEPPQRLSRYEPVQALTFPSRLAEKAVRFFLKAMRGDMVEQRCPAWNGDGLFWQEDL